MCIYSLRYIFVIFLIFYQSNYSVKEQFSRQHSSPRNSQFLTNLLEIYTSKNVHTNQNKFSRINCKLNIDDHYIYKRVQVLQNKNEGKCFLHLSPNFIFQQLLIRLRCFSFQFFYKFGPLFPIMKKTRRSFGIIYCHYVWRNSF